MRTRRKWIAITGTLLGVRNGDCFTRYTGEVLQADKNAATNILHRGTDVEITRFHEVRIKFVQCYWNVPSDFSIQLVFQ